MRDINLAVLGFGNVGRSFARYVRRTSVGDIRCHIRAIADVTGTIFLRSDQDLDSILESGKTVAQHFPEAGISDVPTFIRALPRHGIAVLVECLPTNICDGQPALSFLRAALSEKISVVTVDKGPIVHGAADLAEQARRAGVRLVFSGTTGVRPPAHIANLRVLQIQGVLNGTTNFVLTEMQEHSLDFRRALAKAQDMGIAEPDPSLDIDGWDTSCKILILANAHMQAGQTLADVYRSGIGLETESLIESARSMGHRVRLIGSARIYDGRVRVRVAPKLVDPDSPFFNVSGTSKVALFVAEGSDDILVPAKSGRDAIAQVIAGDVVYAVTGEFPVTN